MNKTPWGSKKFAVLSSRNAFETQNTKHETSLVPRETGMKQEIFYFNCITFFVLHEHLPYVWLLCF